MELTRKRYQALILDLYFTTDGLTDLVNYCRITKNLKKYISDYRPMETELDITISDIEPETIYR